MADFDGFTMADGTDAPPIWTCVHERGEVIVAGMSDGTIQVARFSDGEDSLVVTFSAFDESIGSVLHTWFAGTA